MKKESEGKIVAAQAKRAVYLQQQGEGDTDVVLTKVTVMICNEKIADDSSSEEQTTSSEPEDHLEWEWRVSKGKLGLSAREVRLGKRTVVKTMAVEYLEFTWVLYFILELLRAASIIRVFFRKYSEAIFL